MSKAYASLEDMLRSMGFELVQPTNHCWAWELYKPGSLHVLLTDETGEGVDLMFAVIVSASFDGGPLTVETYRRFEDALPVLRQAVEWGSRR